MRNPNTLKVLATAILPLLFFIVWRFGCGLMILTNQTHSLPYTFFLYCSKVNLPPLKKGDFILLQHHLSTMPIIKKVLGVEGDLISKTKKSVRVGDSVLPLQEKDSKGHAIVVIQSNRVKDNCVFVSGSHPQSFDSRYETFGLVDIAHVKGVVWPLF